MILCAGVGVGANVASAGDDDNKGIVRVDPRGSEVHKEGEYGGVTPGVTNPYSGKHKNKKRKVKNTRRNTLYVLGFQSKGGGSSRLFAQLSRDVSFEQWVEKNVLYVVIEGLYHRNRNARRRLDVRYFDTSLMMITNKRASAARAKGDRPAHKRGIRLQIQFKNPNDARSAQASVQKEADGFYYLYLDFGPGTDTGDDDDDDDGN
jgi:hypothetical protein